MRKLIKTAIPKLYRDQIKQFSLSTLTKSRWFFRKFIRKKRLAIADRTIVSLTSYPARYNTLHLTLTTLLCQNVTPAKIILWIAEDDISSLPSKVTSLLNHGIDIEVRKNLRSYDKLVHLLREMPEYYAVIADDDVYYPSDWLFNLLRHYDGNEKRIICHRSHQIQFDARGNILPYAEWEHCKDQYKESNYLFPTGMGGVFYPPNIFDKRVTDQSIFTRVCPTADDIWFYLMARVNGATILNTGRYKELHSWPEADSVGLHHQNVSEGANDLQLKSALMFLKLDLHDGK